MFLEPLVEPHFQFRPKKSALQAVGVARERCWRFDWVIDLDIRGFYDNLDHALIMRAVGKYTDCRLVLMYIERWLTAPAQLSDGTLQARTKGTPQGGVVSPVLANIFLHLAFDDWMRKTHPTVPFERYADDVIAHCVSEEQALLVKRSNRGTAETLQAGTASGQDKNCLLQG
jgi:retron-type reverse transcriptase